VAADVVLVSYPHALVDQTLDLGLGVVVRFGVNDTDIFRARTVLNDRKLFDFGIAKNAEFDVGYVAGGLKHCSSIILYTASPPK